MSITDAIISLVVGLAAIGFTAHIRVPDFLCHVAGFVATVATLYVGGAVW